MHCGEILKLLWEQLEWNANLVRLERKQTKGKQARVAPLYGELRGWLEMAYGARLQDCVSIVSWRGHGITEVKTAWSKARERAGVPELPVHDLRRTAARNMIRASLPEKKVMLIAGWKTRNLLDRYDITDERDLHAAGLRLERYAAEQAAQVHTKDHTIGETLEGADPGKLLRVQ